MATGIVHARVEASTLEQLRANAAASDRTLAQEVRRALRMYAAMLERQGHTGVQNGAGGSAAIALEPTPEP